MFKGTGLTFCDLIFHNYYKTKLLGFRERERDSMEEEDNWDCVKTPLLLSCSNNTNNTSGVINGNGRVKKSYSFSSIRFDFFSKLPEKLRSGLDPEALLDLDLTKTTGLFQGIINHNLYIYV